ncbi:MAG: Mbeg1-like protein [Clostridia bacterium]
MNIIDYALCQNEKFELKRLNKVDSLIFSQLCYFDFDTPLNKASDIGKKLYIKDLAQEENLTHLMSKIKMTKEKVNFIYAIAQSSRYCDIEIVNQKSIFSKDENKQFSATTFLLNKDYIYIAFRGTDTTIVGWKEDFMIAYSNAMPSYGDAVEYFNKIANILIYPHIFVGGHSKGGNIAVFAATRAQSKIQDRIVNVFNHDGPGFRKDFFQTDEFKKIADRAICIVPENSVVGMIWDNGEKMEIIKSNNLGVFQHNPFSWLVQGDDFAHSENLSGFSKEFKTSLSDWLYYTSNRKKEAFFDAFINVFEKAEAKSFGDFFKNIHKNLPILMVEIHKLDPETKEMFVWVIKKIASIYVKNSTFVKAGSEFAVKLNSAMIKVGEKLKDIKNEKLIEKEEKQKQSNVCDDGEVVDAEMIVDDNCGDEIENFKVSNDKNDSCDLNDIVIDGQVVDMKTTKKAKKRDS